MTDGVSHENNFPERLDVDEFIFTSILDRRAQLNQDVHEFVGDWVQSKGTINLISIEATVSFNSTEGRVVIGLVPSGAKINSCADVVSYTNYMFFGASARLGMAAQTQSILPPAGLSPQVWPLTGPLPPMSIVIASDMDSTALLTMVVKLKASGPRKYRFAMDWATMSTSLVTKNNKLPLTVLQTVATERKSGSSGKA